MLAIGRVPGSEIVGLCDREIRMARQLGERCGLTACFGDLAEMLEAARPDIVHITTPPAGHLAQAQLCLEWGAHVYLEKPFTIDAAEAERVLRLAETRGLKATAGHNYQFTPEMMEMRRLEAGGFLGGKPVHVESHWSYDLGDVSYVAPMLGSRGHWVRQLPGGLLHNNISHGIARLAEHLDDDLDEIVATARTSPALRAAGGEDVRDELRVMIVDKKGTTAFFCFSTQLKPALNRLRVCGPGGSILVDQACGSAIRCRNRSYKSYLAFFVPPLVDAKENLRNAAKNIGGFLARRLYQDAGMKELIERFHRSVETGGESPIPYREILLTARILDEIFAQLGGAGRAGEPVAPRERERVGSVHAG